MQIERYKLKIRQWFNRSKTYKQAMRGMYSIVYGQCTKKINQKLETFPEFAPIKEGNYHKPAILILELIKITLAVLGREEQGTGSHTNSEEGHDLEEVQRANNCGVQ